MAFAERLFLPRLAAPVESAFSALARLIERTRIREWTLHE
jgi:hypothetical protein